MDTINYKRTERVFIPDLQFEKPTNYGKYGYMRLTYLQEHRQDKYLSYLMNGCLNQHLLEVDTRAKEIVERQIKSLLKTHPAPDRNDTLAWTGHMNNLKQMAEEIVIDTYLYR